MEMEDSFGPLSPTNPFADKLAMDLAEDDDNETVIDSDFDDEDIDQHMQDVNQIERVLITESETNSTDRRNNGLRGKVEEVVDERETDAEEIVANCMDDDLLMGSQLLAKKYKKNVLKSDTNDAKDCHKRCQRDIQREKDIRVGVELELELERQQRIHFQKLYEHHMSYSLRKELDDCNQIKSLKLEILKCRQELQTLKRSLSDGNDVDLSSHMESTSDETKDEFNCENCSEHMKTEASLILHLINHCIGEEEFRLETTAFKLDEFTASVLDGIRKSVAYYCPRCLQSFNCLEIYYHVYKCHTKEMPLICTECHTYFTHLDVWRDHNQSIHNGSIQSVIYADIGTVDRRSAQPLPPPPVPQRTAFATTSRPNGPLTTSRTNHYSSYATNRSDINSRPLNTQSSKTTNNYSANRMSDGSSSPEVINLSDSPPPPQRTATNTTSIPPKPVWKANTNSSNFSCDFPDCDFKTNSKDKLQFHISAHTNSKFKCPYCPYVGNILNDIYRHIQKSKKHENMRVYECRECSYGTNCLSSFKEHLSRKHFDDSDEEDEVNEYITDMFRNHHSTTNGTQSDSESD